MKELKLNLGAEDAKSVVSCIKGIAGRVSADDIVEIIIKAAEAENRPEKDGKQKEITMTSREIADALGRPHTVVVKQIAKFLCENRKGDEAGFILTSFVCSHKNKKSYPMYELTEDACKTYRKLVAECGAGIQSVTEGLKRYDMAVEERFHPAKKLSSFPVGLISSGFLLEGKPRKEYEPYCDVFNQFIAGPACEGREIAELTEKYKEFYKVMQDFQLTAKDSNRMETAMYNVAIEAEMQGFIYGFKLFDAILNTKVQMEQHMNMSA